MNLNDWDYKLIHLCKSRAPKIEDFKSFWAERCALNIDYVNVVDICDNLIEIVDECGVKNDRYSCSLFEIIKNLSPGDQWKYGLKRDKNNYWENVLAVMVSKIQNLEIKYIPGYEFFIEKQEKIRYIPKEYGDNWQIFDLLENCFWQGCGCTKKECEEKCEQLNKIN